MFITKEQAQELHKAGLGHVCLLNGQYVSSDGFKELSEDELARVQEICTGASSRAIASPKEATVAPKQDPGPVQRQRGWPKGKKRK